MTGAGEVTLKTDRVRRITSAIRKSQHHVLCIFVNARLVGNILARSVYLSASEHNATR
jgi:hypothetical protein